jgi:hypothetical protein
LRVRHCRRATLALAAALVASALFAWAPSAWAAKALPRYFPHLRPLLMGDAYVAVGDEASTVFYNPAGIANLPKTAVEVSIFPLPSQFDLGPILADALIQPEKVKNQYQDLTSAQFKDLLGTRLYSDLTWRLPFVTLAERGLAFGFGLDVLTNTEVLGNPVLPGLHLELHADALLFMTVAGNVSERLTVGITPKLIDRIGIDKVFTFGELFAAGSTLDLENNPSFKDLKDGKTYISGGVDLGFIYRFPFWESWEPRFGAAALNIGGYDSNVGLKGIEFGKRPTPFDPPLGGELPQLNSVGFAVSPTYGGIRYTVALDMVDVTRTVLLGNDWMKRTRAGLEIGIGIKSNGTALFSVLTGLNANHGSFGVLSRVWIFEVGFGTYEVELGQEAGDQAEKRTVFEFSLRF